MRTITVTSRTLTVSGMRKDQLEDCREALRPLAEALFGEVDETVIPWDEKYGDIYPDFCLRYDAVNNDGYRRIDGYEAVQ